jgi:exosortase A
MTAAIPLPLPRRVTFAGWRPHLIALAITASAILLLFHRDAIDMVRIWLGSSTYNHCALIPPIIGWLVWQRLPQLRALEPVAWWPGLLLVSAGAGGWLLGQAGGVALARHAGLVLMLQGCTIACLGGAVSRGLAFPIAYAIFLIPAGEEMVPAMQRLTAEMTMTLLGLTGVPAHIEGVFISIANGYFEVAEACAGVKFLIAMVALGALVANLCFRSWHRRAAFMAAAVAVPILANVVRAWATIFVASRTSSEFASGMDHVIYGWVFFAVVIALTLALGWRFFDRAVDEPWFDPIQLQPVRPTGSPLAAVAAAVFGLAAMPVAWSAAIASVSASAPAAIRLPDVRGWKRVPATSGRPWQPHFAGADRILSARYRDAAGRQVDLAIILFDRQEEGREIVGYGQGAAGPESGWAWSGTGPPPQGGRLDRIVSNGIVREVAVFYHVGGVVTGSEAAVKLATMRARLTGGSQAAVALLVSAEAPAEGVSPRSAIDAFLAAAGPVDALADPAAGLPRG